MLAVAQGAYETGLKVVGYGERDGQELQEEKRPCVVEDVGGRVDEVQDLGAEGAAEQGDDHGQHHADAHGVAHIRPHLGKILGAEGLRHRYGEAGARAVAETHDEKHDAARRSHSGQGAHADPSANDDGVDHLVHLLENIAQYERHGKAEDAAGGRSHGHVGHAALGARAMERVGVVVHKG